MEQELPSLLQSYELRGKKPFVFDFSRLLQHAIEKGRGIIYTVKKKHGTPWGKFVLESIQYITADTVNQGQTACSVQSDHVHCLQNQPMLCIVPYELISYSITTVFVILTF